MTILNNKQQSPMDIAIEKNLTDNFDAETPRKPRGMRSSAANTPPAEQLPIHLCFLAVVRRRGYYYHNIHDRISAFTCNHLFLLPGRSDSRSVPSTNEQRPWIFIPQPRHTPTGLYRGIKVSLFVRSAGFETAQVQTLPVLRSLR